MNPQPKPGDSPQLVQQVARRSASVDKPVRADAQPVVPWHQRWEPVLAFVSQQRFRLLGFMATATVSAAAALVFFVALVIKVDSPISPFVLNVVAQSPFSQAINQGVRDHYNSAVVEAAEAFQATGQAPPGVTVTQRGSVTEVDTSAIRARMPLNEVMLGAAAVALAFAVAAGVVFRQLRAAAPSEVTPRRLWVATVVLVWLEVWAYTVQGVWGLSLLLFAMGGISAGLLMVLRRWPKQAANNSE
jgi:hypothetical protein